MSQYRFKYFLLNIDLIIGYNLTNIDKINPTFELGLTTQIGLPFKF